MKKFRFFWKKENKFAARCVCIDDGEPLFAVREIKYQKEERI